ncbi:MAG: hypothetical protein Kow0099_06520 [Candidatus Abyssubacteria bacterium]
MGNARLIDISDAGLCMEISPLDSDLFMELQGTAFILSTELEIQIFCRSHPINIAISGSIKWFKRKKEMGDAGNDDNICVGVIFSFANSAQKKEVVELLRHLKNDTIRCGSCDARVSANAVVCYNCGSRPMRKRTLLRKMLNSLLTEHDSA